VRQPPVSCLTDAVQIELVLVLILVLVLLVILLALLQNSARMVDLLAATCLYSALLSLLFFL
jgi:hypothetical protein